MIPGIVNFTFHKVGGWRVVRTAWDVLPPVAFIAAHEGGSPALVLQGNFNRKLREGTWCKRPHKEVTSCSKE